MSLLKKLKFIDGSTTLGIDAYSIYNPKAITELVNRIYNYIPLPDGPSPIGLDYKTLVGITITTTTIIGGLVFLIDSLRNNEKD